MKNIAILGSTGSIGTQTLDVVRAYPELFNITVLVANNNDLLLEKQIIEFSPEIAVLANKESAERLLSRYNGKTKIKAGKDWINESVTLPNIDIVVTSMMGFAGLEPTLTAIKSRKNIALANKETLVVAGEIVTKTANEFNVSILPVDSEHCALFQCLQGEDRRDIEKMILTASGGPFRGKSSLDLKSVTSTDCLKHPTWSMGKKITIDSATLVNKGLEVIEAHWLYDIPYNKIQVVIHPQSIIHSMVEYKDGAIIAQLGSTDMKLPIQYALTYPNRLSSPWKKLDFWNLSNLTFEKPDIATFEGLKIAYDVGNEGGILPCIFNAANEIAVECFLQNQIRFLDIYEIIKRCLDSFENTFNVTLSVLYEYDELARNKAKEIISSLR